ncbi:MAG: LacI family DNA-binding transcriptional regulator [Verrucomicrobiota bacterium]
MTKPKKSATVHDVAKAAGVAVGSVSRALNNHADVTPDIRERILAAAKFLNYTRLRKRRVGGAAAARRAAMPGNIGLICFGMEDALVELPVVSAAMHGIESAIGEEGGTLMFASIPKGDRVPAFLAENKIAGVIVKGPNQGELPSVETSELLRQIYRVPHVWLMGCPPNAIGDHCNFDAYAAGRIAGEHLHVKGHRRVAFLNPKPGHAQFENVKLGFTERSRALGSTVELFEPEKTAPLVWPLPSTTSAEKVDALVQRWASQPKTKRATAIAVGADTTAVQIYSALGRLGLRVGRDVGLISCNDEKSLIMGLSPALTTVDVQADAVGRNAVARVLWRVAHPMDATPVTLLIRPVLTERESVPRV